MNLRALVSVSGKTGLFKLIGQNKAGFILEGFDGQKTKTVVNMSIGSATVSIDYF